MKNLMIIISIVAMVFVAGNVLAQTPATTRISNEVTVTADNATTASTVSPVSQVRVIAGASYTAVPADSTGVSAGSTVDIIFTIRNDGNLQDDYTFAVVVSETNPAVDCGGSWGSNWLDAGAAGDTAENVDVGNTASITLRVAVSGTADDTAYFRYRVEATSANAATAVMSGAYIGDNSTAYCGNMGVNWAGNATNQDGILRHYSSLNDFIELVVSGPVLTIQKTITYIQLGGTDVSAIPGATIRYEIFVTNTGTAAASNVRISDPVPANCTFVQIANLAAPAGFGGANNAGTVEVTNANAGGILDSAESVRFDLDVRIQ